MAFFKAVSEGERNFRAIAVVGDIVLGGGPIGANLAPQKNFVWCFWGVTGV